MIATPIDTTTDGFMLEDMNGPLCYWGPAPRPAQPVAGRSRSAEPLLSAGDREVLARLAETLHGRTWAGTNALITSLFAAATPEPVAA